MRVNRGVPSESSFRVLACESGNGEGTKYAVALMDRMIG